MCNQFQEKEERGPFRLRGFNGLGYLLLAIWHRRADFAEGLLGRVNGALTYNGDGALSSSFRNSSISICLSSSLRSSSSRRSCMPTGPPVAVSSRR